MRYYCILTLVCLSVIFCSANGQSNICNCDIKLTPNVEDDSICVFVEKMPIFDKGNQNFISYLFSEIKYEGNNNIVPESDYLISFVINRKGKLIRARVGSKKRKNYTIFEKKILKAMKKSPIWTPGSCEGIKVPILFKLRLKINWSDAAR